MNRFLLAALLACALAACSHISAGDMSTDDAVKYGRFFPKP